jgi:hypothetical protein
MDEATPERWLPVPDWEDLYEVSDLGRVRSLPRITGGQWRNRPGQVLKPYDRAKGYKEVSLMRGGRACKRKVHLLVLAAFVGPRPTGLQTRHLDGNPANNKLGNLIYGTPSENNHDRVRHGTHPMASRSACSAGHDFLPETSHWDGKRRVCDICAQERGQRWYEANRDRAIQRARESKQRRKVRGRPDSSQSPTT